MVERNLVHLIRWSSSPPQSISEDKKCNI